MKETMLVNLNWSPKKMERFLSEADSWSLYLDDNMSSKDLKALFLKHINSPYCSSDIIEEIAGHQNTPVKILRTLSKIGSAQILSCLALNSRITDEIANIIIEKSNDYIVLEHLIFNPKISNEVLTRLLKKTKESDLKALIRGKLKKRASGHNTSNG